MKALIYSFYIAAVIGLLYIASVLQNNSNKNWNRRIEKHAVVKIIAIPGAYTTPPKESYYKLYFDNGESIMTNFTLKQDSVEFITFSKKK